MANKLEDLDTEILVRLADYCLYLYEEEKSRTERLERKAKFFSAAFGGSMLAILLKLPFQKLSEFILSNGNVYGLLILLAISTIFFIAFTMFVLFVYRIQRFERLTDPKETVISALNMENENMLLAAQIADYAVSTNRNHNINERKARHLTWALACLLVAIIVMVFGIILIYLGL